MAHKIKMFSEFFMTSVEQNFTLKRDLCDPKGDLVPQIGNLKKYQIYPDFYSELFFGALYPGREILGCSKVRKKPNLDQNSVKPRFDPGLTRV